MGRIIKSTEAGSEVIGINIPELASEIIGIAYDKKGLILMGVSDNSDILGIGSQLKEIENEPSVDNEDEMLRTIAIKVITDKFGKEAIRLILPEVMPEIELQMLKRASESLDRKREQAKLSREAASGLFVATRRFSHPSSNPPRG